MKALNKISKAVIEVGKTIAKKPLEVILVTALTLTPVACKKHKHPTPINQPPVASAGIDQIVYNNKTAMLDGTGSRDPDGLISSYQWTQISGPSLAITNTDSAIAVIRPKFTGVYGFQLTVTDSQEATSTDDVQITSQPDIANLGAQYSQSQTADAQIIDYSAFLGLDGNLNDNEKIFIDILVDTKNKYGNIPQDVLNKSLDWIIANIELTDILNTSFVKLKREVVFDSSTHYNAPLLSDAVMQNRKDDDWINFVPADLRTTLENNPTITNPSSTLMQVAQKVQEDVQIWAAANSQDNCLFNSRKINSSMHHFIGLKSFNANVWEGGAITGLPYLCDFDHEEVFLFDNSTNILYILRSTINYIEPYGDPFCVYFNPNQYGNSGYTNDQINTLYLEFAQAVDRAGLKDAKRSVLASLDKAHDLDIIEPPTGPMIRYTSLTRPTAENIVNTKINSGYNITMYELIKKLESIRESDLTVNHNKDIIIDGQYRYSEGIKYVVGFNGTNYRIFAVDNNSYSEIFNAIDNSNDLEYDGF